MPRHGGSSWDRVFMSCHVTLPRHVWRENLRPRVVSTETSSLTSDVWFSVYHGRWDVKGEQLEFWWWDVWEMSRHAQSRHDSWNMTWHAIRHARVWESASSSGGLHRDHLPSQQLLAARSGCRIYPVERRSGRRIFITVFQGKEQTETALGSCEEENKPSCWMTCARPCLQ